MITIPFLDLSVPTNQYYNEALSLNDNIALKTISIQEALSQEFENIVISDQCLTLTENIKSNKKFLWIIEPHSINIQNYQIAYQLKNKVDLIFSHTKQFLDQVTNSVYCPWGSYFINPKDHKIYNKHYNTTIIASSKTYTVGHRMRHEVISKYEKYFDYVRRGGTSHSKYQNDGDEYKLNFIKDYRFSVEIENAPINGYFTEKLLDCFRTGTIPIYCGDPGVIDIFNKDGIISFSTVEELEKILPNLNKSFYDDRINAVVENYNIAENFLYPWKVITNKLL